jgi:hypothetical protein
LAEANDRIDELEQERTNLQGLIAQRENELNELEKKVIEYQVIAKITAGGGGGSGDVTTDSIVAYQKELENARRREKEIQQQLEDLQSRGATDINRTFNEVDEFLEKLPVGNAAFQAPKRIKIGDKALVKLLISQSTELDTLLKKLSGDSAEVEMNVGGKPVKLHTVMRARLNGGNGIAIRPLGEEEIAIGSQGEHEWVWEIEAKETGKQILRLQLYAIFKVQDKERAYEIKTFEESIEVQVSALYEIKSFLARNWQWLWAVVLVPLLSSLFAWWKRKSKKKSA